MLAWNIHTVHGMSQQRVGMQCLVTSQAARIAECAAGIGDMAAVRTFDDHMGCEGGELSRREHSVEWHPRPFGRADRTILPRLSRRPWAHRAAAIARALPRDHECARRERQQRIECQLHRPVNVTLDA